MEDVEMEEVHGLSDAQQSTHTDPIPNDICIINDTTKRTQVDDLLATPEQGILPQPPQRRQRQKRTFDMTAVRRSACLAKKPALPPLAKTQRNLYRKLGLPADEVAPIEQVLRQYINTIDGPLPDFIIAALTTFLDLDNEVAEAVTTALVQQAGEGLDDLQHEQDDTN
ncbi:unnamed protein product [Urochloa humidicola]